MLYGAVGGGDATAAGLWSGHPGAYACDDVVMRPLCFVCLCTTATRDIWIFLSFGDTREWACLFRNCFMALSTRLHVCTPGVLLHIRAKHTQVKCSYPGFSLNLLSVGITPLDPRVGYGLIFSKLHGRICCFMEVRNENIVGCFNFGWDYLYPGFMFHMNIHYSTFFSLLLRQTCFCLS